MSTLTVPRREGARIVIHEVPRSQWWTRLGVGLLGLAILGACVSFGLLDRLTQSPLLLVVLVVAVMAFGAGALLASRQRGQFEILELDAGRLRLRVSETSIPIFEAPVGEARFQRVKHPLGLRLMLRDHERAVEVGQRLPAARRADLADMVEQTLSDHANPAVPAA